MKKVNSVFKSKSVSKGVGFGITSGVITTLGLITGLYSATGSRIVVIGGVISIAIADAFSDALGIHISEESEGEHNEKEIWKSTLYTFFTKFVIAFTFIIPFLLFSLDTAMIVGIGWGLVITIIYNWIISIKQNKNALYVIGEHLLIMILVIVITYYVGDFIARVFV